MNFWLFLLMIGPSKWLEFDSVSLLLRNSEVVHYFDENANFSFTFSKLYFHLAKLPRSGSALPPYSIEYQHHPHPSENNDGPMTPRKVKRRSTSRNSTRGSKRSNRRYRNPVTKMMDRSFETSSNDSYYMPGNFYRRDPAGGVCNPAFDHAPSNPFVMNLNGRSRSGYNGESETVIWFKLCN